LNAKGGVTVRPPESLPAPRPPISRNVAGAVALGITRSEEMRRPRHIRSGTTRRRQTPRHAREASGLSRPGCASGKSESQQTPLRCSETLALLLPHRAWGVSSQRFGDPWGSENFTRLLYSVRVRTRRLVWLSCVSDMGDIAP
jgi:hypothetical protein